MTDVAELHIGQVVRLPGTWFDVDYGVIVDVDDALALIQIDGVHEHWMPLRDLDPV